MFECPPGFLWALWVDLGLIQSKGAVFQDLDHAGAIFGVMILSSRRPLAGKPDVRTEHAFDIYPGQHCFQLDVCCTVQKIGVFGTQVMEYLLFTIFHTC